MPTYAAHAKLNLLLSVGAPEPADAPDHAGWHRILSWFACIDLKDDVTVERLPEGTQSRYDIRWADDAPRTEAVDWPVERDLAAGAHRALEAHTGRPLPVSLHVRKRIPTGAGLGGGSSDAAATLLALRDLFELSIGTDNLRAIGATLGSDVAFFVEDRAPGAAPAPAVVSGFGETLERTDAAAGEIILVIPPFRCATPAVYAAFDAIVAADRAADERRRILNDQRGPARGWGPREELVLGRVERMLAAGSLQSSQLMNDLEKAAFAVEPRLGALSTALSRITRQDAHMTGSGSCLFLVPPAGKEEWTLERVRRAAYGAAVVRTSLVVGA